MRPMLVTLGESLTMRGRREAWLGSGWRDRRGESGSVPKTMPPWLVLGQLALSSYMAMPGASLRTWMTSRQSSMVKPKTLAMTASVFDACRSLGSFSSMKARTPMFWRPMALIMPAAVSMMRGVGLPAMGSRERPLVTKPPMRSRETMSSNSTP